MTALPEQVGRSANCRCISIIIITITIIIIIIIITAIIITSLAHAYVISLLFVSDDGLRNKPGAQRAAAHIQLW